jgi:hypothetical protein
MTESFAEHPVSIGEIQSDRSGDGKKWTPRDVLVKMLRMIDSGEVSPDVLVVAYGEMRDGNRQGHFWQSTPDGMLSLGLMQSTIFKMQD